MSFNTLNQYTLLLRVWHPGVELPRLVLKSCVMFGCFLSFDLVSLFDTISVSISIGKVTVSKVVVNHIQNSPRVDHD